MTITTRVIGFDSVDEFNLDNSKDREELLEFCRFQESIGCRVEVVHVEK